MLRLLTRPPTLCATCAVFDAEGRVLLGRSRKGRRLYQLPGGHVEAGETAAFAAGRETFEETGCVATSVTPVKVLKRPERGKTLIGCVALYAGGAPCDSDELSEVRFYDRDEIDALQDTGALTWQTAELLSAL